MTSSASAKDAKWPFLYHVCESFRVTFVFRARNKTIRTVPEPLGQQLSMSYS